MGVRLDCWKGGGRVCRGRLVGGFGGGEIGETGAGSVMVVRSMFESSNVVRRM